MFLIGGVILLMAMVGFAVSHIEKGAMARVESQRLADAATASAEALERSQASAEAQQVALAQREAQVGEARTTAATLQQRLSAREAELAQARAESEAAGVPPPPSKYCPDGSLISLPVIEAEE